MPTEGGKICIVVAVLASLYYIFATGEVAPGESTRSLWRCLTDSHSCWESSTMAGRQYSVPTDTLVNRADMAKVSACIFGGLVAILTVGGALVQRDRDAENAVYRANEARRLSELAEHRAEQQSHRKRERAAATLVAEQSKAQCEAAQLARLQQEKVLAESHNDGKDAAWAKLQGNNNALHG